MALRYSVIENKLKVGTFKANAVKNSILKEKDIAARIGQQGGTVSEADALATLKGLKNLVNKEVAEGNSVHLGFVKIRVDIKGRFENINDQFDPARHKIKINMSAGEELKKHVNNIITEKVSPNRVGPEPNNIIDETSGTLNSIITPGSIATLLGEKLKINRNAEDEGVFFKNANNETFKVQIFQSNFPKMLVFLIPAELTSSKYSLIVRNSYKRKGVLEGRFVKELIVS